ncbi:penicillin-binding protein 2 [Octadecabacter sp. 1_MG-2023]|uniref:penicillin-binding protein 2 n=1 Tax=unclassified Octadecabacter TaxID=196158 RepID=UPI001C09503A|nr:MULTISPECIES: penicillin-binding protein 2 [unclassified Octadecabacter]MBU2994435.1 penicillin-binding protein 2 [Octadecabacter sp. B2R22]MDO6734274.1 penicillin-binding protein 2 [Octadecabacter sp. 1_MG-2023]
MKRGPKETEDSNRRLSRRAMLLGTAQLGIIGILGARMGSMQVEQADTFRMLAEENRINIGLIPPARGLIYDANGVVIADNEQHYTVTMTREGAGDVDEILARLGRLIALDPERLEKAREELKARSPFVPVTVAERMTWEDVARVTVNAPALPGVVAELGRSRIYPQGADLAHVVGYVGPVSDYDLSRIEDQDPLLQIPRFQIGKTMVENRLEQELRGSAGTKRVEVNAAGRVMRELDRVEGIPGADIQLTVDAKLQNYMQARLHGDSAAAIVMDVTNGDIKGIASAPTYDPNVFVQGISTTLWNELNEREVDPKLHRRPLAAKTVQGTYPPGSTFKMVTALAALEDGVIEAEDTVRCVGHADVFDVRFHCWKRSGHGNMNLNESLKQSCDVYYYDIAQRVGIDKIAAMGRKLGLGERHELPMSAIRSGIMPDKAWKRETRGEDWRVGDTVNASIGQGYVATSPLQLAVMSARIATGRAVAPRLVRSIDGVEQPSGAGESLGINENNLRRVRRAMYDVSNNSRGTAYRARIAVEEFKMAGKTGTSQVRAIARDENGNVITRNADLPWEARDHALYVAFAPAENPKYAVAVVVEHGGGGSTAAAPIARDVLLQALYDGTPPLSAYPSAVRGQIADQQRRLESMIRDIQPGRDTEDT